MNLQDIPKGRRQTLTRWLRAARRRITPMERWTTGTLVRYARDERGKQRPVAWCAIGSLHQTLERQGLTIHFGEGNVLRDLLNQVAQERHDMGLTTLNDSALYPNRAHEQVLAVYDEAIRRLSAPS